MDNTKLAALAELGILCRGKGIKSPEATRPDTGPHTYSGHAQFCGYEHPNFQYPFEDKSQAVFSLFPKDTTVATALSLTRMLVFLGAAPSDELLSCLKDHTALVVLFEPDEDRLVTFLEQVRPSLWNRPNLFIFTGAPYSFDPPLQDLLPEEMFRTGTPAFFLTDFIRGEFRQWADEVMEYFEILHYRYAIYGISGQSFARSRPVRNITRGLLFDQQLHALENVPEYVVRPSIDDLTDRFKGRTAILVAAGPDLSSRFEFIRENRENALVICVNNAVKPLVEAGIHPHFVIINDTSIASGKVFDHIPPLPDAVLVAHALSALGGEKFQHKVLFGSFLPGVFGERTMIPLHGSVISTAFGLARMLGCTRCVFVGAQLASDNPWGLGYAKGTLKDEVGEHSKPLINRHPQLYPVTTPFGDQLYTTINFRDAALWLAETIRLSGIDCVNTSRESILYGEGITHDPAPVLKGEGAIDPAGQVAALPAPRIDRVEAKRYLEQERMKWTSVRDAARTILGEQGDLLVAKGMAVLAQLDKSGVTSLVERFEDFDNRRFHRQVFGSDGGNRVEGLKYYFKYVFRMAYDLLEAIETSRRNC